MHILHVDPMCKHVMQCSVLVKCCFNPSPLLLIGVAASMATCKVAGIPKGSTTGVTSNGIRQRHDGRNYQLWSCYEPDSSQPVAVQAGVKAQQQKKR